MHPLSDWRVLALGLAASSSSGEWTELEISVDKPHPLLPYRGRESLIDSTYPAVALVFVAKDLPAVDIWFTVRWIEVMAL